MSRREGPLKRNPRAHFARPQIETKQVPSSRLVVPLQVLGQSPYLASCHVDVHRMVEEDEVWQAISFGVPQPCPISSRKSCNFHGLGCPVIRRCVAVGNDHHHAIVDQ